MYGSEAKLQGNQDLVHFVLTGWHCLDLNNNIVVSAGS